MEISTEVGSAAHSLTNPALSSLDAPFVYPLIFSQSSAYIATHAHAAWSCQSGVAHSFLVL